MKDRNKKNRKIIYRIAIYVILGSVAVFCLTRNVRAKYITEVPFSGNVKIDAGLAQEFHLYEHKAVIDTETSNVSDGVYKLEGETVDRNTYTGIMPNSDIAKDPFITIKNKTDSKAYLYVEVCKKDFPEDKDGKNKITYFLTDEWKKVTYKDENTDEVQNVKGINGGTLYVYVGKDLTKAAIQCDNSLTKDKPDNTIRINILEGNKITVDSTINNSDAVQTFGLDFYGYLAQIPDSMLANTVHTPDVYEVYCASFGELE